MRLSIDKLFVGIICGLGFALPTIYFNNYSQRDRDIATSETREDRQVVDLKPIPRDALKEYPRVAETEDDNLSGRLPNHLIGAAADDPDLINHIRRHMFVDPYPGPPKILHPERTHFSQVNQSAIVDELLEGRRNGFFIECGAAGGVGFSNSIFFERSRGWSGLLVEANPQYFHSIRQSRRANFVSACLSPSGRAEVLNFTFARMMGGVSDHIDDSHMQGNIIEAGRLSGHEKVSCLPLYSLLLALNVDHVDYFSLDVEGPELKILRAIPFDKITIDVLTIEFSVARCRKCADKKLAELEDFFSKLGNYEQCAIINRQDVVYRRIA